MANLGAEVSRIISATRQGNKILIDSALPRAEKIIQDVKDSADMKPRMKEIEILSKVIHAIADPLSEFYPASQSIEDYFTPFATRLLAQTR